MEKDSNITKLLVRLETGDPNVTHEIWEACYPRLVTLARRRLEGLTRKMKDEEDVALSALKSFFKAAERGRFPDLRDSDDLWRLLCTITVRKAIDVRRYEARRPTVGESRLGHPDPENCGMHHLPANIDEAAFAEQISEVLEHRLTELPDDLREMAIAKLEGYTNEEIAERMQVALRTVERRLHLIRRRWEATGDPKEAQPDRID